MGYDALIHNYDFDYSWDRSVTIRGGADDKYEFTYNTGAAAKGIVLMIEKVNGRFKIASVGKN